MRHELNPSSEILNQLRPHWDKVLVAVMRKHGIREVTLDGPEFEQLLTPPPVMVALGRKHVGEHGGFTLVIAKDQAEAIEIVAKQQGRG